jgi:hypothetical protein
MDGQPITATEAAKEATTAAAYMVSGVAVARAAGTTAAAIEGIATARNNSNININIHAVVAAKIVAAAVVIAATQ